MNLEIFQKMDAPQLRNYIQFLLWHYRVVDAFWYLNITEQFDQGTADQLNEKVWGKVAAMAAKDLVKRFDIQEKGLKGFVRALKHFPWCILVGYQIQESDGEVLRSALACLGIGLCLILLGSCVSFDIRDWPSGFAYPHNADTSNWCGAFGAFCAYYLLYYIGPGIFLTLVTTIFYLVAKIMKHLEFLIDFNAYALCSFKRSGQGAYFHLELFDYL